jgi:hypothetical protein
LKKSAQFCFWARKLQDFDYEQTPFDYGALIEIAFF